MAKELSFFEELQSQIEENVQGVHVATLSDSEIAKTSEWIGTPALDLNRILSGNIHKGIPTRTLCSIVGPEHTFKSSFMVLCMAAAQKQGFTPVILDTEHGCDLDFCKRWGMDPDNAKILYTPWVHNVMATLAQLKDIATRHSQQKLIIGLDSAGGLDLYKSYTNALADDIKADQGLLQKSIRSMLKLFLNVCIETNSIGIVTGHMYGSPSTVPMPDQVGGGKAMRLFPNLMISLKKEKLKDGKKDIIGNLITATTLKNRVYPPFQQASVEIDFQKGINKYAGILTVLEKSGLVTKEGNSYFCGETKLGGSYDKAEASLVNFPALLDDLNKWLETTGYSTINPEVVLAAEKIEAVDAGTTKEEETPKRGRKKNV
jgi:RecA/RadA recombinase